MTDELRCFFKDFQQECLFDDQQNAEVKTPHDKVPAGTVPQSRAEPYDCDVQQLMLPVAAQGDIHIVTEECSQRDVPSAPEFGCGSRYIGVLEVFGEVEAAHKSQTDSHIGIARKVVIYLERIKYNA